MSAPPLWRGAVLGLLLFVLAAPARAEVQEGGVVRFPTPLLESMAVRNPQGPLTLRGWDRDEVHISFRKRAPSAAMLEVLRVEVQVLDGRMTINTGIEVRGQLRPLPQPDAAIDLVIDAPRRAQLVARTFSGELQASGFRNGIDLDTRTGPIRVHDISGVVRTHAGRGDQSLRSIQGAVHATGVNGDMDLAWVEGPSLSAEVVRGQIQAREIRAAVVELQATLGTLVLMGGLWAGARYDLSVEEGELRLLLPNEVRFTVEALGQVTENRFRLQMRPSLIERPGYLRGEVRGGGPALHLVNQSGPIRLLSAP